MSEPGTILLGKGHGPQHLFLALANRHGLVAGATGTGKTVTLQVMAEAFSRAGVPVFCADVKGDLSGISMPGEAKPRIEQRAAELGVADFAYAPSPAIFWDLFGEKGHPVRTTVAEMGPLLLARMLELNDTQEGVLNIAFKLADDEGLLLLDFNDLIAMLQYLAESSDEITTVYGMVSKASIGAIQRRLLTLEQQGAEYFFGEPALELADMMLVTPDGKGAVNVLMADRLIRSPRLYSTFLLWLLSELFEELPEAGDLDKPKLVFFFDEAHLLFDDAPKALVDKIEQVVRLIRSKGVGVYFVTQNPADLPSEVLGQLGNRVQHALRAFTPVEQKAVRAAAGTFRPNPDFDTQDVITQLGVGEALVSVLEPGGVPSIVQQVKICPPRSRMGPIDDEERAKVRGFSPLGDKYDETVDRESAFELLNERATSLSAADAPHSPWGEEAPPARVERDTNPWGIDLDAVNRTMPASKDASVGRATAGSSRRVSGVVRRKRVSAPPPEKRQTEDAGALGEILFGTGRRQGVVEAMSKSLARSLGSQLGRSISRGMLGSITKR